MGGGGCRCRHGAAFLPGLPGRRGGAAARSAAHRLSAPGIFYTDLAFSRFIEPLAHHHLVRNRLPDYVYAGLTRRSLPISTRRYRTETLAGGERRASSTGGGRRRHGDVGGCWSPPATPTDRNIFIIIYLYFMSQNLVRYRLLDGTS